MPTERVSATFPIVNLEYESDGWLPIASAPLDRDLELAVVDHDGVHALVAGRLDQVRNERAFGRAAQSLAPMEALLVPLSLPIVV